MGRATSADRRIELGEVDSTNACAQRLAEAGERGPLWIRATAQTAGRGRKGRHWVSRPGNLYTTLLFTPDAPAPKLAQLGFVAALAIYDLAADCLAGDEDLSLKWPNDVLLCGCKVSGILAETLSSTGTAPGPVAVGCGINLQHAPDGTRYGATALADHGADVSPAVAWPTLIEAMNRWLVCWNDGAGFNHIRDVWMDRCGQLGAAVSLDLGDEIACGRFQGLADDGALVLEGDDGTRQMIRAGDVLRTDPGAC